MVVLIANVMLLVTTLTGPIAVASSAMDSPGMNLDSAIRMAANTSPDLTTRAPHVERTITTTATREITTSSHRARTLGPKSLLTLAEAQSVVTGLWPRFVNDVETSSADVTHVATPHVIKVAVGELECGCLRLSKSWTSYELTAPIQTAYPLTFLAEVDNATAVISIRGVTTRSPFLTYVIFEKTSAKSGWEISRFVGAGGASPMLAPTDSRTMATTPQPDYAQFSEGFAQLIVAMNSARNTGRVPTSNMWSRVGPDQQPGTILRELEGDHRVDIQSNMPQQGGYTWSTPSTVFSTKSGSMECADIVGTATYRGIFVQPANRSADGPLLAPGNYRGLIIESTRDACLVRESANFVRFAAIEGGISAMVGIP